jgi:nucleoside-diphosphate-sugar epimerase
VELEGLMRVLIIGGTNFIGPWVVRELCDAGHSVMVYHRGHHEADLPASVEHVHHVRASIPVLEFPPEVIQFAPDVALHMVAIGEQDAARFMEAFRGVAKRVVAVSSADVYRAYDVFRRRDSGALEPMPLTEEASLRTQLYPYRHPSQSQDDWFRLYDKILVERAVMSDAALPGTVLRLPAVYGPGDAQHRLFPFIRRIDDGRRFIPMAREKAGWRWTHGYVANVAHAIALAVTDDRAAGRIYNVGDAETPTVAEWVHMIADAARGEEDTRVLAQVVPLPAAAIPPHLKEEANYAQDIALDTSRIRAELGYAEPVARATALRHTIRWQRETQPARVDPRRFDYDAEDAALAAASR